jgi:hypothetical protein
VTLQTRSGNSATPDASWSAYEPLGADGQVQSPGGRYVQYKATLSTADDRVTPSLNRVELGYEIDDVAPSASLDVQVSGSTARATFSSPSADLARFECSLDGGAFAACASPKEFAGLAAGSHAISVRAVDKVGNVGVPASRSFAVAGSSSGSNSPVTPSGGTPDTSAPKVLVMGRSARVSKRGVAKLKIRCPRSERSCDVAVKLKLGGKRVARKRLELSGGGTGTFALKLSKSARKKLAKRSSLKATATVSVEDAAGNERTTKHRVTLLAPTG